MSIYIYGHPPPYDRPRNCISSLSRKGAEDQHSKIPRLSKNPKTQKTQPKFRIFGNSSGSLKIQKSSKILEFPKFQKSKNSNPSFGFLETRAGASKSQNRANSSTFQNSKNSNPRFGFLETRAGASKSKNRANSSTFQNSKNPNIPTQVSDFWKLERERQNPKIEQIPRVSKIPNLGVNFFGFLEFWKLEEFARFLDLEAPARVSKILKIQKFQPKFRILETRTGASKSKNRANSSSFQNSKNPKIPTQVSDFWKLERERQNPKIEQIPRVSKIPNLGVIFLEFWKLEEFARFLDLEAPARVSKILKIQKFQPKFRIFGNSNGSLKIQKSCKFLEFPKFQTLGWFFLDFWNFGKSRNLLDFWILRLPFEFPKIQTFGVDFWIFGILETGVWIRFFQGFVYDSLL